MSLSIQRRLKAAADVSPCPRPDGRLAKNNELDQTSEPSLRALLVELDSSQGDNIVLGYGLALGWRLLQICQFESRTRIRPSPVASRRSMMWGPLV